MVFVYVFMALVGAAAALFAIQNLDPVVVRFLGLARRGHAAGPGDSALGVHRHRLRLNRRGSPSS